jgi:hypothetical protein
MDLTAQRQTHLQLPAGVLVAGQSYEFRLVVIDTSDSFRNANQSSRVQVLSTGLVATVNGGPLSVPVLQLGL